MFLGPDFLGNGHTTVRFPEVLTLALLSQRSHLAPTPAQLGKSNAAWATGLHGTDILLPAIVPWTAASARCCLVLLCLHLLEKKKKKLRYIRGKGHGWVPPAPPSTPERGGKGKTKKTETRKHQARKPHQREPGTQKTKHTGNAASGSAHNTKAKGTHERQKTKQTNTTR